MGISTEEWRSRVGSYAGRNFSNSFCKVGVALNLLVLLLALGVICYILVIGCVELNPGPFPCKLCRIVPETIASNIYHQHSHAKNKSFLYTCPGCQFASSSFGSLKFHVSVFHREDYHQDPEHIEEIECVYCTQDSFYASSLWQLVQHFYKQHNGTEVECPIEDCSKTFTKKQNLQTHLSQHHKNWRAEGCPKEEWKVITEVYSEHPIVDDEDPATEIEDSDGMDFESSSFTQGDLLDDELFMDHIAKFYLSLYAVKLLPQTTIQHICDSITFMTDIAHARIKLCLSSRLRKYNIPEDEIDQVCHQVRSADLVFSAHHKTSPGPSLTSHHLRKKFFKINYGYIEPKEIPLSEDDPDLKLQYVPIKRTLSAVLQDRSVQKDVDASFLRFQEHTDKVSDYTDGTLFLSEDHPLKEIRLFLYVDAVNPVMNVLGSAKNKYKNVAVYLTLANLKPHHRSKIFTKHLVMLVRETVFKKVGVEKCFEELMKELTSLETKGIEYKGETVKVVLQFMLGDNLGQHQIGGFIECFTGKYFCRFCDVKKNDFRADPNLTKPPRTKIEYDRCVMKASLTGEHCKGIKKNPLLTLSSIFMQQATFVAALLMTYLKV